MGVANERSIAWGIAKACSSQGAQLAFTYQGEALKKRIVPLAESVGSSFTLECDVANQAAIKETFLKIKEQISHSSLPVFKSTDFFFFLTIFGFLSLTLCFL